MGQTTEELRADIELRREQMSGTVDAIQDRVMPGRIVGRRKEAARQWFAATRERVMGTDDGGPSRVEQATGRVQEAAAGIRDVASTVTDAPAQVARQTRGAPLIAGGIAAGIGALVAFTLPETDSELRVAASLAPQLDATTDAAKQAGQHVLDAAKGAAQEATSDLKDEATSHSQQISGEFTEAAQHLASETRGEVDQARDQVR